MARLIIGTFPSRADAEAAQRALAAEGLDGDPHRRSEGEAPPPGTGALESIVGNLFSGMIPPPPFVERLRKRQGEAWMLAVRGLDDERAARVRSIVSRSAGEVEALDDGSGGSERVDIEVALFGPDIGSLPNGSSGWRDAAHGSSPVLRQSNDPGRPRGLLDDAAGLAADADVQGAEPAGVPTSTSSPPTSRP